MTTALFAIALWVMQTFGGCYWVADTCEIDQDDSGRFRKACVPAHFECECGGQP